MPATPSRIGFITEQWRRVAASSNTAVTRHGSLSRQSDDPVETFFDSEADAQIVATERQSLLSPERRRFTVVVAGVQDALSLNYVGGVPVASYVDSDRDASMTVRISEITFDFKRDAATLTIWG